MDFGQITALKLPSLVLAQAWNWDLARAAQDIYDDWDEADVDTFAGGGICHFIAEKLAEVLDNAGIHCETVACTHEQHVYVVAKLQEGVFKLDIPYHTYELGGGYSWTKIPGVIFNQGHIVWTRIDANPENYFKYVDD